MAQPIVDILVSQVPQFTVNTGATDVSLTTAAGATLRQAITNYNFFANLDNANVLEVGLNLPYQYRLGAGSILSFTIGWINSTGSILIPVYSGYLPLSNAGVSLANNAGEGLYMPNPQGVYPGWAASDRARMYFAVSGNVSMIAAPAAIITGTVLQASCWAKVQHLLPMEAP